jgi:hypothetical protein
MKRESILLAGLLGVWGMCIPAHADPWEGAGTAESPYLIYDANDMQAIGADSSCWNAHFKLMADIDMSGFMGTQFNIIGYYDGPTDPENDPFTGVFDGNGHTITNFTYTCDGPDGIGLFGLVGEGARIKNLGVENVNIDAGYNYNHSIGALVGYNIGGTINNCHSNGAIVGGEKVGGLVGYNKAGIIAKCSSAGSVTAGGWFAGGLVGRNHGTIVNCNAMGNISGHAKQVGGLVGDNVGIITSCCATGSISASGQCGGLVGDNSGSITNSYSWGDVTASDVVGGFAGYNRSGATIRRCYSKGHTGGWSEEIGGLVGDNTGSVYDSYWDIQSSGESEPVGAGSSSGINGLTTVEMQDPNTFLDAGWDFVGEIENGPSDDWAEPTAGGGYMIMGWQLPPSEWPELPSFSGGTGYPSNPYLISTSDDLKHIGHNFRLMTSHFRLINNIDLTSVGFSIIGGYGVSFNGVFDGNGYTISDLRRWSRGRDGVGLFGYLGEDGLVQDLALEGVDIDTGDSDIHIGGLVGRSYGTISNCRADGSVAGGRRTAGLVGDNSRGAMANCYWTGAVTGSYLIGGLVGSSYKGSITSCYSTGTVVAPNMSHSIGGLVGDSETSIAYCYSAGSVTAGDDSSKVGGLVGTNHSAITRSFSTGSVTALDGSESVGGLVGVHGASSGDLGIIVDCYSTATVTGNRRVGGLVGAGGCTIANSYAAGHVTGNDKVGGLVGLDYGAIPPYAACFWNSSLNPSLSGVGNVTHDPSGVIGASTTAMRQKSTFTDAGWDFFGETDNGTEDIWTILEGINYPELTWQNPLALDLAIDNVWMYQNVLNSTDSELTADVLITDDPLSNGSYAYEWEIILPDDVSIAPTITAGGGSGDPNCTFAAPSCNEPNGLSDSGQTFTVRVTVTGADFGNTGIAEAEFGIALLGDVNNDGVVNVADRSIINAFWRLGAAGPFTFRDCDVNCDGAVNVADRSIANAIWRGVLGQNRVSNPCPLR